MMSTTWSFAWKRLRSLWMIADLRNKILFTLGLLLIYRVLAHIIVPLTHQEQANLVNLFGSNKSQNLGQLLGLLDVFSGGSLQTFSIVALGLAPYITATIVMQLLQPIIPALHTLSTQGEAGRLRFRAVPFALPGAALTISCRQFNHMAVERCTVGWHLSCQYLAVVLLVHLLCLSGALYLLLCLCLVAATEHS